MTYKTRKELRPLRNQVNRALQKAKIPHARWTPSRIRGMSNVSEGWETESMEFDGAILVKAWGSSTLYSEQALRSTREMRDRIRKALDAGGFEFTQSRLGDFVVTKKEAK